MKNILSFDAHSLHNDEHNQFHVDITKTIEAQTPAKFGIEALYQTYVAALVNEQAAMQVEQGSAITKTITESDAFRDQLSHGFALFAESQTFHYNPKVQEAAIRVKRILDQYGDLRNLPYNEESSAITNAVTELKTNYSADVATINGTEWLDALRDSNNEFMTHFGERANEAAARASGNVRAARQEVDAAYKAIMTRINALVTINGDADYASFIDQVNYYINYYKTVLAGRKGRNSKGDKPAAKA
jgi:hypothetical protein